MVFQHPSGWLDLGLWHPRTSTARWHEQLESDPDVGVGRQTDLRRRHSDATTRLPGGPLTESKMAPARHMEQSVKRLVFAIMTLVVCSSEAIAQEQSGNARG